MTAIEIPMDGVARARFQLMRELGHTPDSLAEYAMETALTKLFEAVNPTAPSPTKTSLAELAQEVARIAHEKTAARPACADCGHAAADHRSGRGCFECGCPSVWQPLAPAGAAATVHAAGAEVTVTARSSRYFGRLGLVIAREGAGVRVLLPGGERLHFEHSELAARVRRPLANFYPAPRKGK